MRDIKFRAWATQGKKMIDLKAITPLALDKGMLDEGDGLFLPFRKDIILMQFTGLKDKNGVEIYEGDIIKSFDETLTVFFNPHTAAFEVMYDYPKGDCETIGVNEHSTMEVIGNIYERKKQTA